MCPSDTNSIPLLQAEASLDDIAVFIRKALEQSRRDRSNALYRDLDAGDALIEAQKRVSSSWKGWLRQNCLLSVPTAFLYMQLARHRAEIETEIERVGELSLRAARRLISKPTGKTRTKTEKPELVAALDRATDDEIKAALILYGLESFLRVMPNEWRPKLEERVGELRGEAGRPDLRVTAILRKALSLVKAAAIPGTSKPVADSNRCEALAALGQVNVLLAVCGLDLNDIMVAATKVASQRSRRRA